MDAFKLKLWTQLCLAVCSAMFRLFGNLCVHSVPFSVFATASVPTASTATTPVHKPNPVIRCRSGVWLRCAPACWFVEHVVYIIFSFPSRCILCIAKRMPTTANRLTSDHVISNSNSRPHYWRPIWIHTHKFYMRFFSNLFCTPHRCRNACPAWHPLDRQSSRFTKESLLEWLY